MRFTLSKHNSCLIVFFFTLFKIYTDVLAIAAYFYLDILAYNFNKKLYT